MVMDIIILIIAGSLGIILGSYFAKRRNAKLVEKILVEKQEEDK